MSWHVCIFYNSWILFYVCFHNFCFFFFFFSSRRRHTRFDCDWSSDVCSSDLTVVDWAEAGKVPCFKVGGRLRFRASEVEARSEERRVGKSVDLGGRRIIKKKKKRRVKK